MPHGASASIGAWSNTGATIPQLVGGHAALAVVGDYIYIFNFWPATGIYRAPVSNPLSWTDTGTSLPISYDAGNGYAVGLFVVGDYIYIIARDSTYGAPVVLRAPVADPLSWTNTGVTIPVVSRLRSGPIIIGNYIYLYNESMMGPGQIFRAPTSNPLSWSNTGSTIAPYSAMQAVNATIGSYIYRFGGVTWGSRGFELDGIYRAAVSSPLSWADTGSKLSQRRSCAEMVVVDDYAYLLGGFDPFAGAFLSSIERAPLTSPTSWAGTAANLPTPLSCSHLAVIDNYIYLFGGEYANTAQKVIYRAPYTGTASTLDKPWKYYTPSVDCTFDGNTVGHGESVTAYETDSPASGISCASISETRTCNNGTLSGTYQYATCDEPASLACNFTGYAWSDTIGWISLGGSNYGLTLDDFGNVSGFAWSDNVGWIQGGSLAGFPVGSGTVSNNAKVTGTSLTGWLKALAGGTAQSGGWDGWISLGGTNHSITRDDVTGEFSGYAWGDVNLGWIDFSYGKCASSCTPAYSCSGDTIQYTSDTCVVTDSDTCVVTDIDTCSSPAFCSQGAPSCILPPPQFIAFGGNSGHLQIRPQLVRRGGSTNIFWNLQNVSSCTVTGTNGDTWTADTSGPSGQASSPVYDTVVYTLECTGLDSSPIRETANAGVVPVFKEI